MTDATLTAAEGVGTTALDAGVIGIPRSVYLYENMGLQSIAVLARSLYEYENKALQAISVLARSLYEYEDRGIQALTTLARALYLYEATRDTEVFPWLMRLNPTEQVRGGQVDLYGDGLGEIVNVGPAAAVTVSSSLGGNVAGNAVDGGTAEWASTESVTDAWIRFTWASPKVIVGFALEGRIGGGSGWGVPTFRFSDGGADVAVTPGVPAATAGVVTLEYPIGGNRTYYALPAPRTCTWAEVRSTANGIGISGRGFHEVLVFEDADTAAETSSALLVTDGMGIVVWHSRSPGLWPANSEVPILPAATVTVPPAGVSGLVTVKEIT